MTTGRTIALAAAVLLALATVGCGTSQTTAAGDTSSTAASETTAAPETTTMLEQPVTTAPPDTTTTTAEDTTTAAPPATDPGLAEEYAVYSALIQSKYIAGNRPALVVIEEETVKSDGAQFSVDQAFGIMRSWRPKLDEDVFADFKAKNQAPSALERRFTLSVDYMLMSEQELSSTFASGHTTGWDDFYKKYPNSHGIVTLSRVGFNKAKDVAVVYAGNQWHWTAGEGGLLLLKKTDGKWVIDQDGMYWVS
jgi:hypothetical protein